MWNALVKLFKDSETIFWARCQAVFGTLALIVTYIDPHLLTETLPENWVIWYMLANGIGTEYLRRRRADLG